MQPGSEAFFHLSAYGPWDRSDKRETKPSVLTLKSKYPSIHSGFARGLAKLTSREDLFIARGTQYISLLHILRRGPLIRRNKVRGFDELRLTHLDIL